jgi:hypothetical protein
MIAADTLSMTLCLITGQQPDGRLLSLFYLVGMIKEIAVLSLKQYFKIRNPH